MNHRLDRSRVMLIAGAAGNLAAALMRGVQARPPERSVEERYPKFEHKKPSKASKLKKGKARL